MAQECIETALGISFPKCYLAMVLEVVFKATKLWSLETKLKIVIKCCVQDGQPYYYVSPFAQDCKRSPDVLSGTAEEILEG